MEDNSNMLERTDENKGGLQIVEKQPDLRYGWGKFRPKCLQVFNSPKWFMVFLTIFSTTQGMTVMGITSLVLPTIEKRFHMTAKDLGFIAASNDISAILIVCFVSFYGGYGNKIRWLGYGAFVTGLGALCFMLPHLLVGSYTPNVSATNLRVSHQDDLCVQRNVTKDSPLCEATFDSRWYYLAIFSLAQMLMGAGTTPLWSLGPAYIDENVHPKSSPIYLAIWFAATILGPGMGYLVGAPMLSVYVDLKLPKGVKLTPRDPQWIGAWWLGYFAAGFFLVFSSVFVLGFPIEMPGAREMREKAMKEGDIPKQDDKLKGEMKDILPATLQLLRNPTFMFNTAGTTIGSLFGGGIGTFIAKILQLKFNVSPVVSGIAMGSALIPGAAGGVLIGGFIVRRFKLKNSCKMSAKFCVIFQCISLWGGLCWLIPGCDELLLAGVSAPYFNSTAVGGGLSSSCNFDCACPNNRFNPVCGSNQITYFSPCHAGCTGKINAATYMNCSCVPLIGNLTGSASSGFCYRGSGCKNFIPFLCMIMVLLLAVFISTVPNKTVVIRSVPYNQRAFALGFQFIFLRALGFLPGPIIFGALVDSFCLFWSDNCGERGNCLVYNITQLSYRILTIGILLSGTALLMFFLSYRCYKPEMDEDKANDAQRNDANENLLVEKETVL